MERFQINGKGIGEISSQEDLKEAFMMFACDALDDEDACLLHDRLVNEENLQAIYDEAILETAKNDLLLEKIAHALDRPVGKPSHRNSPQALNSERDVDRVRSRRTTLLLGSLCTVLAILLVGVVLYRPTLVELASNSGRQSNTGARSLGVPGTDNGGTVTDSSEHGKNTSLKITAARDHATPGRIIVDNRETRTLFLTILCSVNGSEWKPIKGFPRLLPAGYSSFEFDPESDNVALVVSSSEDALSDFADKKLNSQNINTILAEMREGDSGNIILYDIPLDH